MQKIAIALTTMLLAILVGCASPSSIDSNGLASGDAAATAASSGASSQASSTPADQPSGQEAQGEPMLVIEVNGATFNARFEDNSSAESLADLLRAGPITLSLHDYGDFEKVGPLGITLPTNDARITTQPGDVILYQGDKLTIYYDENTWSFTRLAHIEGATRESLLSVLGEGDVEVVLSLAQ